MLLTVGKMKKTNVAGIIFIILIALFSGCFEIQNEDSRFLISYFEVEPAIINPGETVKLLWDVIGAISVSIDNGIGNVNLTGGSTIAPTETTTYTLTATNATNTLTATVQITVKKTVYNQTILIDDVLFQNAKIDTYNITNTYIQGDTLEITLQYSGGCEEHEFNLIGTGEFLDLMQAEPVQTSILLSHNANNDLCEAFITEILFFDLTPLKNAWQQLYERGSGTMIISLDGFKNPLVYAFGENPLTFLNVTLSTDETFYELNESISIVISATNTKDNNITLEFPDSQVADFEIHNEQGEPVYQWSYNRAFNEVITPITLPPGETIEILSTTWNQNDNNETPIPSGQYSIKAWIPGFYYSDDEFQYFTSPGPKIYSNILTIYLG